MAKTSGIAEKVRALAEPLADELGIWVWDVEYVKEGADKYLRITIDTEDGVNIEDCEKFHRAIDPLLDEADPIAEAYHLEVSSPGIERELKCIEHVEACEGWDVEVKLYAAVDGAKRYLGVLVGMNDDDSAVTITLAGGENKSFELKNIAKLQTYYDFK